MNEKRDTSPLEELDRAGLIDLIIELRELVEKLREEIQSLRDQLNKNSRNSSKPPSSDGFKKPKSLREKGKRANGGQLGHAGKTLYKVENPDVILPHLPQACGHCQADLSGVGIEEVEKRQVFDIAPAQIVVSEHHGMSKICPCCGKRTRAVFPTGVNHGVQYGPHLRAQIAYLSSYQLIPTARLSELLNDFYGQTVSEATILDVIADLSQAVEPSLEAIKMGLLEAAVLHSDETSVWVDGKTEWLHVLSNQALTYYHIHEKRGQKATNSIGLIPEFTGYLLHDAFASYFVFEKCQHVLCNAHILRELTFLFEEQAQAWAGDLKELLLEIKRTVEQSHAQGQLTSDQLEAFGQRYAAIVGAGQHFNPPPIKPKIPQRGRQKQSPARNLLQRLEKYQAAILMFMHDFRVPFDNNLAERDLRMMKLRQKISGGFRTKRGAHLFARVRSYISTVRKHGNNVLETISSALIGDPFIPHHRSMAE